MYAEIKEIYSAYVSKHNSNCEAQVILLIIPNKKKREARSKGRKSNSKGQKWHYLAVKKTISIIKRKNFKTSC